MPHGRTISGSRDWLRHRGQTEFRLHEQLPASFCPSCLCLCTISSSLCICSCCSRRYCLRSGLSILLVLLLKLMLKLMLVLMRRLKLVSAVLLCLI